MGISMQSFQCLRLLVLVLVVTAANATRRRRGSTPPPTPTGHLYTSAARAHWKQCVSEGGNKNCAQCSGTDSGSLDCAAPSCVKTQCPSTTHKDCPEYFTSQVLPSGREKYGPRFFQVSWLGGECKDFSDLKRHVPKMFHGWKIGWDNGEKTGTIIHGADKLLPGCNGTFDGPHVISKAIMEHPKYADKRWVALVHKRLVMHPHTTTNVMVADVFKVGLCVKCQTDVVTQAGDSFANAKVRAVAANLPFLDKEAIETACLKKAFDSNTRELKPEYRCVSDNSNPNPSNSYGYYQSFLAAF